jgi:hypothetical protein
VQRESAGKAHQRVPLLKLGQLEQRRVKVDLVSAGEGDRPAVVDDQLHAPSRRAANNFRPCRRSRIE